LAGVVGGVVVVVVALGSAVSNGGGWAPYFSGSFTPSHTNTWFAGSFRAFCRKGERAGLAVRTSFPSGENATAGTAGRVI
jgi:hypothetical protein